jgi:hypothetical protein
MAYQTGTSTGADDLLGIISTFAVAQGFVQEQFVTITGGKWLTLSYSGMYYHFVSQPTLYDRFGVTPETEIRGFLSTGYNPGSAWNAQTGSSDVGSIEQRGVTNGMTGPFYAYHLFGGDGEIHCVIEITSTEFSHINFGVMSKTYSGTGGHYITGTQAILADASGAFVPFHDNAVFYAPMEYDYYYSGTPTLPNYIRTPLETGSDDSRYGYFGASYSTIDGSTVLMPITIHFSRPDSYWSYLGYSTNARYVNLYALQSRQEITLGSETWKVFPLLAKSGTDLSSSPTVQSGYYGIAYKKVV